MNTIGNFTHPNARTKPRKKISIGKVTRSNVSMTILGLGSGRLSGFPRLNFSAACNDVDVLETNIEPTLPGKPEWVKNKKMQLWTGVPLMTMASRAKPRYRLTNTSSTMPVALLMTMAPNSGDHPWKMRCRTCSLRWTRTPAPTAMATITRTTTSGSAVVMKSIRPCETSPTNVRVTKSPRHAAMGGAMLSVLGRQRSSSNACIRFLAWIKPKFTAYDYKSAHKGAKEGT
jgi:hypothetical protein